MTRLALCFVLVAALSVFAGCGDLEENHEDGAVLGADPSNDPHDVSQPWDYPYYLIVGGGLSETLSVLTVSGPGEWSIANDVQQTCSGINQMTWHDGTLFALCSLSNSLMSYEPSDLSILSEVSLGVGHNPMNIAFDGNDRAYVSNFLTNDVTYHNVTNGEVLTTIALPPLPNEKLDDSGTQTWPRPGGLLLDGDRLFVAVANLSSKFTPGGPGVVGLIDAVAQEYSSGVYLGGRDTTELAAHTEAGCVYAASAGDYEVGAGFAGNGVVECLHADDPSVIETIATGGAPLGQIVVAPNGRVYVGNAMDARVLSFQSDTHEVLAPIDLREDEDTMGLSYASALAVDGNGYLYVTDFNRDRLFVVDTDTHEILAGFDTCDGPDVVEFVR